MRQQLKVYNRTLKIEWTGFDSPKPEELEGLNSDYNQIINLSPREYKTYNHN